MILSASRRTDIPAFFSDWFFNRVKAGYTLVRNPVNPTQVGRISLAPGDVDGIVFWTRNPAPMMDRLDLLQQYSYYFLYTITPYGEELEKNLPSKGHMLGTFTRLSQITGMERVIWRYDPIILTPRFSPAFHYRAFEDMAGKLESHTGTCIISFLDMYNKCKRNLAGIPVRIPGREEMLDIASNLNSIARKYGITVKTCAEEIDFTLVGVEPARCVDDDLLSQISGRTLRLPKDRHQRKHCRCVQSVDIGAYNTCGHHCLYCYANADPQTVAQNIARHDPLSPLLTGHPSPDDKITDRTPRPNPQNPLFK